MIPYKKHIKVALGFFFFGALLGLLLRYALVFDVGFMFRYVVHAHSHVAVMGWLHIALATLIVFYFLKDNLSNKKYRWIFGGMFISVAGMLASFPFQGYAFFSILFSSLFLITSYFYTGSFFKHSVNVLQRKSPSYITIKWALIYMVISSLGPWGIGAVMATMGQDPFWYNVTIYFYLHFQYNAWIMLGLLGVFLRILENNGIYFEQRNFRYFIRTFNVSAFLTFFISVLFSDPAQEFYTLALLGSSLQFISFFTLFIFLKKKKEEIKRVITPLSYSLLKWAFWLFLGKTVMQLMGSFPHYAHFITTNHNLAIGFLHWVFLGIATFSTLALLFETKLIQLNKALVYLFTLGFIATEALIFYRPLLRMYKKSLPSNYNGLLLIASLLIFIPIAGIFIFQFIKNKKEA